MPWNCPMLLVVPGAARFEAARTPQQSNGYDCGMFCVLLMELLSAAPNLPSFEDLSPALTAKAVLARRRQLVDLIHTLAKDGGAGVRHAAK
jgi:Ulp1 family protease